jgi:hypothetical protein
MERLGLNRTHQLLVYTDDVNVLGKNINIIRNNNKTLAEDSKEVGLKINTGKIKNMFMAYH